MGEDVVCVDLEGEWSESSKIFRHPDFKNKNVEYIGGEVGEGGDHMNLTFRNIGEETVTIPGDKIVIFISEDPNEKDPNLVTEVKDESLSDQVQQGEKEERLRQEKEEKEKREKEEGEKEDKEQEEKEKKLKEERENKEREERELKEKEEKERKEREQKEKEERENKAREERERKDQEERKAREEKERKEKE